MTSRAGPASRRAGGLAVGLLFCTGLTELNRLAETRHRFGVVSASFAAAYPGMGVPAILAGLISRLAGTVYASAYTTGLMATTTTAAIPRNGTTRTRQRCRAL